MLFGLGYGFHLYALLACAYPFILVVIGIATLLGQSWGRFVLSILLPLQACGLIIYVIYKTPRPGQICDLSCYTIPLESTALPVLLSFMAAWVIFPGFRRTGES
jgi:hypothetical protein